MDDRYFAIIPAVFVIAFLTVGVLLVMGKCAKIIPNYNENAKNEHAKFFEKIACRYAGVYVLVITGFFALVFVALMFEIKILLIISAILSAIYAMFGYIYLVNNTRLKRCVYLAKNLEKNPNCISQEELEKWKNELGNKKRIIK